MKCVVVNDASCLIDLGKAELLPILCSLPYRFVVPLPIRKSEILNFTDHDWQVLDSAGMITHDLSPEEMQEAFAVKQNNPALSANDCICFVTARIKDGILLTGDAQLARTARRNGVRVHGVLWVTDRLKVEKTCSDAVLADALNAWLLDSSVFLPEEEILGRLSLLVTEGKMSPFSDIGPGEVRDGARASYGEFA